MRDELAPDANIRHRPLLLEEIDKYVTVIGDASKVSTITNANVINERLNCYIIFSYIFNISF